MPNSQLESVLDKRKFVFIRWIVSRLFDSLQPEGIMKQRIAIAFKAVILGTSWNLGVKNDLTCFQNSLNVPFASGRSMPFKF
jgi:hypothetical protein